MARPRSLPAPHCSWDSHYEREVANFADFGDEGHVWFGEGSAHRMVQWVRRHYEDQPDAAMIDLGCGNGHLVFELVCSQ